MKALFDSNVLVAELVENHVHHEASRLALETCRDDEITISAHSLAECYNQLTRPRPRGYAFGTDIVSRAIADMSARVDVKTLSLQQQVDSLQQFARLGGRGARVYDFLIGQVAALYALDTIVTWNTADFVALFPRLRVLTPMQFLELA